MQKLANVHFANREDCSNQKDHFKDFACDLLWNKRQHEKKKKLFCGCKYLCSENNR